MKKKNPADVGICALLASSNRVESIYLHNNVFYSVIDSIRIRCLLELRAYEYLFVIK